MRLQSDRLSRACRALAAVCLVATALALALTPDDPILRTKLTWSRAGLLASASLLLIGQALAGRLLVRWLPFLAAASVPLALAALHALLGPDLVGPLQARDELERLALLPLGVWSTGQLIDGPQRRRRLFACLALGAIFVGGWALLQRITGNFGPLLPGIEPAQRPDAGFGNPVFLGAWLVLVTPLLLAEALTEPSATRWLSAVAAGLCLPALLASGSAGAWLGFGVAALVGLVLMVPSSRARTRTLQAVALAALALVLIHPNILRPRTHGLIWRDSLAMCLDNPWGVGPGQFPLAFLPYASEELLAEHPRAAVIINDAHGELLQILAELGWPGLIAALAAAVVLLRCVRGVLGEAADRAPDVARLVACVAALAGSLTMSFVSPDLRFTVTVIQLSLVLGVLASYAPVVGRGLPGGRAGRLGLLALGLVGLGGTAWSTVERLALRDLVAAPGPAEAPPADGGALSDAATRDRAADMLRISKLRRDVQLYPDDPQAHYDLGRGLALVGNWPAAAQAMQGALALRPDNPSIVEALGVMLSMAGRHAEALPHLRQAVEADPEDTALRYQRALSAYLVGEIAEATEQVEQVLAADPDHVQGRRLRQVLRQ